MRQGETLTIGSDSYRFIELPDDNRERRMQAEVTMAPSASHIPLHCHPLSHETVDVIAGSIDVIIDGTEIHVGPGESYTVEAGQPHIVKNGGTTPNRFLWTFTPAPKMGAYFEMTIAQGAAAAGQFAIFRLEEYLNDSLRGKAVSAEAAFAEVGRLIDLAGGLSAVWESAATLIEHKCCMAGVAPAAVREALLGGLLKLGEAAAVLSPPSQHEVTGTRHD